jgi:endonuclease/exonuclease/phosphatase family metal-dependent hydrolase
MHYLNTNDPLERIEEGPAILSKFPIIASHYKLLSRNLHDPNDSHQRLCLCATVHVLEWGYVDIFVTHLSLSESSRENTMIEIWDYMEEIQDHGHYHDDQVEMTEMSRTFRTQVLVGDLNAEPSSAGIQFLMGKKRLQSRRTNLRDAWLDVHGREPQTQDEFTFPSDRPVKRIDFVMYRGNDTRAYRCDVIGQMATPETAMNPTHVGMLAPNSPIYASDHRGVLVELTKGR